MFYVSLGLSVTTEDFLDGCVFMGSVVLSICLSSLVLYYASYGITIVHVVLSVLSMRLLSFVHAYNWCGYGCMYTLMRFSGVCRCC